MVNEGSDWQLVTPRNFEDTGTTKKYDTAFLFHVIEHVTDPLV
jgi:2-polyprenyl-3-methyl-5-hydroxy-6-metoxy-1,4-benzoquinol methylase